MRPRVIPSEAATVCLLEVVRSPKKTSSSSSCGLLDESRISELGGTISYACHCAVGALVAAAYCRAKDRNVSAMSSRYLQ